jgi:polar amino acid transport system substrate-binding protein
LFNSLRQNRPHSLSLPMRLVGVAAALTLMAGCGSGSDDSATSGASTPAAGAGKVDDAARKLLPRKIRDAGKLKMVAPFTFPPYSYLNTDHKMVGSDYDLGNTVAERLGLKPTWTRVETFAALIPSVQNGRFDASFDALASTPERVSQISLVEYQHDNWGVLVRGGNPKNVDPNNICGHKSGGVPGSAEFLVAQQISKECQANGQKPLSVATYQTGDAPIQALISGQMEVYPEFVNRAIGTIKQQPGRLKLLTPGKPIQPPTTLAAVVRPDMPDLARAIGAALQSMYDDGTTVDILKKNGMDETSVIKPNVVKASLRGS